MSRLTLEITEPQPERDGLYHSWLRYVDEEGNVAGVTLEFTCARFEDCPSTVNDGITRLQWMLFKGLLGVGGGIEGVLLGFIDGEFEDIPEWFTGPPVWTDFSHEPTRQPWSPDHPDSGNIVVPIP